MKLNCKLAKATRDQARINALLATLPQERHAAILDAIQAAEDMVNHLEYGGRIKTTQDYYGDYLALITSCTHLLIFACAGANLKGIAAAARINGLK